MVPEITSWTDRQTDTNTHMYSSQYFTTIPVCKVTIQTEIIKL